MDKVLIIDPMLCTGCRLCEVACSVNKTGGIDATAARIIAVKFHASGISIPMTCQQCINAPCVAICPVRALTYDIGLRRVNINENLCIGCRFCMAVCPFGAIRSDFDKGKIVKCDLCDGDPTCLHFCETKAIQYVDSKTAHKIRLRRMAEGLLPLVSNPNISTTNPECY